MGKLRAGADWRIAAALALLAASVLPLFAPPPGAPLQVIPDAGLLERLFPGVPAWWTAARLGCVLAAAVLVARAWPNATPWNAGAPAPASTGFGVSRAAGVTALALGAIQAVLGLFAAQFGRTAQMAYLACLLLPALVLAITAPAGTAAAAARRGHTRALLAVGLVVAAWLALEVRGASTAVRAANGIDWWQNFTWWVAAAEHPERNLLTTRSELGVPDAYMLLAGAALFGPPHRPPSFAGLQAVHVVWILATAACAAVLAARLSGAAGAAIAVAALLFSPFMASALLSASPLAIMTALAAALLLGGFSVWWRRSAAALAALGALTGFSVTLLHLTALSVAVMALAAWVTLRQRPRPVLPMAIAALCFAAAVLPLAPGVESFVALRARYVDLRGQWATLEPVVLGEAKVGSNAEVRPLWQAGRPGPFDIALGAALMPLASPRTAIRMSGDVWFEPISAVLAACALAVCLRHARRDRLARAVVIAAALAVLPAALSSQSDRASLTRNIALPVVLAVLAGVGWRLVADRVRGLQSSAAAGAVVAALVATSGIILFDHVNPRILASSAFAIGLESVDGNRPAGGTLLLRHADPELHWLNPEPVAAYLPHPPLETRAFAGPDSVPAAESVEVLIWTPGLEADAAVSSAVCERWPAGTLFSIRDRAGLHRAFAARRAGSAWQPAQPAERWQSRACGPSTPLPLP